VKAATSGPVWYQLYLIGGREASEAALERARAAGFSALAVTIERVQRGCASATCERHRATHERKYFRHDSFLSHNFFSAPGWLASFLLDGGIHKLPNVIIPGSGPMALIDVAAALATSVVTWKDFEWLREAWPGPIVVKGVLTGDDARRSIDAGRQESSWSNQTEAASLTCLRHVASAPKL